MCQPPKLFWQEIFSKGIGFPPVAGVKPQAAGMDQSILLAA
ncbi:hypothetical protein ALQ78_101629 [Pseudomonas syringae pv. aptata]|nr:Unknown protein sequence [Pseudomonas syringae pv. syringae]KPY35084.1 hypothetical protein ALO65_102173 [Pseudomonas syringae pv. papulans]RMM42422.1 hypothetical protein ALQ78_101629 [Pseudomonas syringae pv. aptata]RMS23265.1 hypothetical protein ALP69_102106 [Pseudomonas syringae pv. aceris]RMN41950.1 hypothetical protein ALQ60_102052 [Pseudomonas syringae pv. papulans]